MLDTILVPVDFSPCSLSGLSYAIQFADKCAAKIVVLHVVDLGMAITADGYAMYDLSAVEDSKKKEAEEQMAGFVRWAKFGRVPFTTIVEVGTTLPTICKFVADENIDLTITATHGRTGLKHVMLGSIAEQLVRHAPCPVLAVPSHPQVRANQLNTARQTTKALSKSCGEPPLMRKTTKHVPSNAPWLREDGHPFPERRKTNKFRESHRTSRPVSRCDKLT